MPKTKTSASTRRPAVHIDEPPFCFARVVVKAAAEHGADVLRAPLAHGTAEIEIVRQLPMRVVLRVLDRQGGVLLRIDTYPAAGRDDDLAAAVLAAAEHGSPRVGSARAWAADPALCDGATLVGANGGRVLLLHTQLPNIEAGGAPGWVVLTPNDAQAIAGLLKQAVAVVEAEMAALNAAYAVGSTAAGARA